MADPKVSDLVFSSEDGGVFVITIRRRPAEHIGSPLTRPVAPSPGDLPADIAQAVRVWLAGNQL